MNNTTSTHTDAVLTAESVSDFLQGWQAAEATMLTKRREGLLLELAAVEKRLVLLGHGVKRPKGKQ